MFSGIVEETARVARLERRAEGCRLAIVSGLDLETVKIGASVAIDGACLTVVKKERQELEFDVSWETLRRSTLGKLQPGSMVNLERALRLGERLDGHWVLGHIDGTLELLSSRQEGSGFRLGWSIPEGYRGFIAEKGSVALSGISLTVGEVGESEFAVYVIPHTLKVTTLGRLKVGEVVNFEVDLLARYLKSLLEGGALATASSTTSSRVASAEATSGVNSGVATGVTWEFLAKHGFGG